MKYILDTANLEDIKHANEFYPICGVTTNPSLVAKEKKDLVELLTSIRNIIGEEKMLHVQTTATKAEEMVKEAKMLKEKVGGNFYDKIPIGEEGLKATMMLKKEGIKVTMTAIFTPQQALIAAKAGASFVAPYVNRLDNILGDGTEVVAQIAEQFAIYDLPCKVLAASFKTAKEVLDVAVVGCHAATIGSSIMKMLIAHTTTDTSISGFIKDWTEAFGKTTLLELIKNKK